MAGTSSRLRRSSDATSLLLSARSSVLSSSAVAAGYGLVAERSRATPPPYVDGPYRTGLTADVPRTTVSVDDRFSNNCSTACRLGVAGRTWLFSHARSIGPPGPVRHVVAGTG